MKVTTLDEKSIRDIGHAFGYYDYEEETGMSAAFSGKEATANYICAYVRGVLRGGFLHTTSERGEGYIAYKLPKEKMEFKTMWPIACGILHNSTLKRLLQFGIAIKRGGATASLDVENETAIQEALSRLIKKRPHHRPQDAHRSRCGSGGGAVGRHRGRAGQPGGAVCPEGTVHPHGGSAVGKPELDDLRKRADLFGKSLVICPKMWYIHYTKHCLR